MWKKLIVSSLVATLAACQPKMMPWSPTTPAETQARQEVRMAVSLNLPAAMKTQATTAAIHHLTYKLYQPADLNTVVATQTATPPFGSTVTVSFPGLADGGYKLKVEAFASSNDSTSISQGGPLTSNNTATVQYGAATYNPGTAFTFDNPLQLASGGTWRTTVSGPLSSKYQLSLVNQATKQVIGATNSALNTISVSGLLDGTYDIWASVSDALLPVQSSTPAKRMGSVVVSSGGDVVTGPTSLNLSMTSPLVSTIAGDTSAKLTYPSKVAFSGGNLYVADADSHTIRRIDAAGTVTTVAGLAFSIGSTNGQGGSARFNYPQGIAVDGSGNLYVADTNNNTVRKIDAAGNVTTVAGLAGNNGSADGQGSNARFSCPRGIAVDGSGNLYVADTNNNTVRKIDAVGNVTTVAGLAGTNGSADGQGSNARFKYPWGITVDGSGNLYVADRENYTIRKIDAAGNVTTVAGLAGLSGNTDGQGSNARFFSPQDITVDGSGNVYVANTGACTIRKIDAAGNVTTITGSAFSQGDLDGQGGNARFMNPNGITSDGGGNFYLTDGMAKAVRKIDSAFTVTTVARSTGSIDGQGGNARFNYPQGITVDGNGNLYVADTNNHTIRKIDAAGNVTTIAGVPFVFGSTNGQGSNARFTYPGGIAVDGSGNLYVADSINHTIRKIDAAGNVTTVAGLASNGGATDGQGSNARFYYPRGIAVDGNGNLYVADSSNHTIRKIDAAGNVTTVAGLAGNSGSSNGQGSNARFWGPYGITVDGSGNLYVADANNNTIRKIDAVGNVTTLAGLAGNFGSTDGQGSDARFGTPIDIAMDGSGNLYVAAANNNTIRKIDAAGNVTTVAGLAGSVGFTDGQGGNARFCYPRGIAVDGNGNLYVADTQYHTIRKIE
jgi:streptogramin lyase